jgi:hypothetical protein
LAARVEEGSVDDRPEALRAASAAPAHDAPPPYRPLSALAVTALVLAVFGALLAIGGTWWIVVPGLVLGALGWSALAHGRKRGRGLALAAAILSILAGVGSFVAHRLTSEGLETALEPFVEALVRDDRATLSRWLPETLPREEILARWRERMAGARERAGGYAGRIEVGDVWWGAFVTTFAPPRDLGAELGPGGEDPPGLGQAFWLRAHFERAPVWVALLPPPGQEDRKGVVEMLERLAKHGTLRVRDVRLFATAP